MTSTASRYSRTAMSLHWIIAILIMFAFGLGERTEHLPRGPALFAVFQLHKSVGITILLLSLWRLGIRISGTHPAPIEASGAAAVAAKTVHWLFYAIMIVVPMSGWILVSTAKTKVPTLLYGLIPWPHLPVSGEVLHEIAEAVHKSLTSYGIPLLLLLHVVGAIRHQFLLREPLMERMTPMRRAHWSIIPLLFLTISAAFLLGRDVAVAERLFGMGQTPQAAAPAVALPATPVADATTNVTAPAPETEAEPADEVEGDEPPIGPVSWAVVPGGRVGFTVTVSGQQVAGRFGRWTADIVLDPESTAGGRISANIDLASVASGDSERDSMLATSDFFDTAANPRARFASSDIRALGGNRYEARGTLSLKGVSKPLRLPFTLDIDGDTARVRGSAAFDRRSFNVGEGQFSGTDEVGADIAVSIAFTARRKPA